MTTFEPVTPRRHLYPVNQPELGQKGAAAYVEYLVGLALALPLNFLRRKRYKFTS